MSNPSGRPNREQERLTRNEAVAEKMGDTGNDKQDCETKAFYRLATRLKKAFPALKIMLLLDGLYATGPVTAICLQNKWQFMIVLKDGSLPSVMTEFNSLCALERKNHYIQKWGNRSQVFRWANDKVLNSAPVLATISAIPGTPVSSVSRS